MLNLAQTKNLFRTSLYWVRKKVFLDTKWDENILYHLINIRSLRSSLDQKYLYRMIDFVQFYDWKKILLKIAAAGKICLIQSELSFVQTPPRKYIWLFFLNSLSYFQYQRVSQADVKLEQINVITSVLLVFSRSL